MMKATQLPMVGNSRNVNKLKAGKYSRKVQSDYNL